MKYRSVKNVPKYINRGRDKTRFIQSHIMFHYYKLWKKTWRDIVIRDRVGGWVPPLCINRACECFHKSPFVSHKWETKGSEGQWRRLGGHNGDTTQTKTQLLLGVWGISQMNVLRFTSKSQEMLRFGPTPRRWSWKNAAMFSRSDGFNPNPKPWGACAKSAN